MLRSMLYVRYGSGWSRLATASAARPRAVRSRLSRSASPSSGVSRSPAVALSSAFDVQATKVNSCGSEIQLLRQLVKQREAAPLLRAQIKVQMIAEVAEAFLPSEPQRRRFARRD